MPKRTLFGSAKKVLQDAVSSTARNHLPQVFVPVAEVLQALQWDECHLRQSYDPVHQVQISTLFEEQEGNGLNLVTGLAVVDLLYNSLLCKNKNKREVESEKKCLAL